MKNIDEATKSPAVCSGLKPSVFDCFMNPIDDGSKVLPDLFIMRQCQGCPESYGNNVGMLCWAQIWASSTMTAASHRRGWDE